LCILAQRAIRHGCWRERYKYRYVWSLEFSLLRSFVLHRWLGVILSWVVSRYEWFFCLCLVRLVATTMCSQTLFFSNVYWSWTKIASQCLKVDSILTWKVSLGTRDPGLRPVEPWFCVDVRYPDLRAQRKRHLLRDTYNKTRHINKIMLCHRRQRFRFSRTWDS
jgi:hypothetical protein